MIGRRKVSVIAKDVLNKLLLRSKISRWIDHRSVRGIFRQLGSSEVERNHEIRFNFLNFRRGPYLKCFPPQLRGRVRNPFGKFSFSYFLTRVVVMNCDSHWYQILLSESSETEGLPQKPSMSKVAGIRRPRTELRFHRLLCAPSSNHELIERRARSKIGYTNRFRGSESDKRLSNSRWSP